MRTHSRALTDPSRIEGERFGVLLPLSHRAFMGLWECGFCCQGWGAVFCQVLLSDWNMRRELFGSGLLYIIHNWKF